MADEDKPGCETAHPKRQLKPCRRATNGSAAHDVRRIEDYLKDHISWRFVGLEGGILPNEDFLETKISVWKGTDTLREFAGEQLLSPFPGHGTLPPGHKPVMLSLSYGDYTPLPIGKQ
ncbi:hypothetical protein PT974_01795 [Cladobotryum mycophilum]|uniref:Uncharacterized protein n=1 Tax=Cladobotryum mycophilum TaxID=491253 RepID=A0ABR0SWB1_9HYPO